MEFLMRIMILSVVARLYSTAMAQNGRAANRNGTKWMAKNRVPRIFSQILAQT